MMRLTPEVVLDAYEKTGMKPRTGWFSIDGCGCAMGVYAKANNKESVDVLNNFESYYRWGLYAGFDGREMDFYGDETRQERNDYETGYSDGVNIRQAVIERYGEFE